MIKYIAIILLLSCCMPRNYPQSTRHRHAKAVKAPYRKAVVLTIVLVLAMNGAIRLPIWK